MAVRGRPRSFDTEQALKSAAWVFWRKGYTATSMQDLYDAMGITSPSLYAAFGSKEGLYEQVIAWYTKQVAPAIWGSLEQGATPREGVHQWLLASAQGFSDRSTPAGCMIALSAVGCEGQDRLGELVHQARQRGLEKLEAQLVQARALGELGEDEDISALARYFVTLQQGMSLQARDGASVEQLTATAEQGMRVWRS